VSDGRHYQICCWPLGFVHAWWHGHHADLADVVRFAGYIYQRESVMDIVERLRICAAYDPDQKEAADEIERLREALEIISDKLYDKGEYDLWAAARNALWQGVQANVSMNQMRKE